LKCEVRRGSFEHYLHPLAPGFQCNDLAAWRVGSDNT